MLPSLAQLSLDVGAPESKVQVVGDGGNAPDVFTTGDTLSVLFDIMAESDACSLLKALSGLWYGSKDEEMDKKTFEETFLTASTILIQFARRFELTNIQSSLEHAVKKYEFDKALKSEPTLSGTIKEATTELRSICVTIRWLTAAPLVPDEVLQAYINPTEDQLWESAWFHSNNLYGRTWHKVRDPRVHPGAEVAFEDMKPTSVLQCMNNKFQTMKNLVDENVALKQRLRTVGNSQPLLSYVLKKQPDAFAVLQRYCPQAFVSGFNSEPRQLQLKQDVVKPVLESNGLLLKFLFDGYYEVDPGVDWEFGVVTREMPWEQLWHDLIKPAITQTALAARFVPNDVSSIVTIAQAAVYGAPNDEADEADEDQEAEVAYRDLLDTLLIAFRKCPIALDFVEFRQEYMDVIEDTDVSWYSPDPNPAVYRLWRYRPGGDWYNFRYPWLIADVRSDDGPGLRARALTLAIRATRSTTRKLFVLKLAERAFGDFGHWVWTNPQTEVSLLPNEWLDLVSAFVDWDNNAGIQFLQTKEVTDRMVEDALAHVRTTFNVAKQTAGDYARHGEWILLQRAMQATSSTKL
jgi:hypothetical protein